MEFCTQEWEINNGDILNFYRVNEGVNEILDYYKNKNYHNASIDYEIKVQDSNLSDIIINIFEGKPIKLKKITINGNASFSNRKLIKNFQNTKAIKWFWPWGGDFNEEIYLLDKKILENFYYNHGYKDFQIIEDDIVYTDKEFYLFHL